MTGFKEQCPQRTDTILNVRRLHSAILGTMMIPNKTILIVDDEQNSRECLCNMFSKLGYTAIPAENGRVALMEYMHAKPDLIITDLRMPELSGMELLEEIRKENPTIPVIIMTAYGEVNAYLKAMNLGAFEYLNKPIQLDELRMVVKKSLDENCQELDYDGEKKLDKENPHIYNILKKNRTGDGPDRDINRYITVCGSIAHSLKSEFLHIGTATQALRELGESSAAIQEECEIIERSALYSQILLRRLIDYLDMGSALIRPIDMLPILKKVEALISPRIPSNIKLHISVDPMAEGEKVLGNTDQLMGVFLGLIDNAANALAGKGGTIELGLEERNGSICVSVKDNGSGIPKDIEDQLFKKQVPSKNGLGMGLFFCHRIITGLGGTLDLQASSGEGTEFMVMLPIVTDQMEH
ncbi:MAG: response regulator [bacterium]